MSRLHRSRLHREPRSSRTRTRVRSGGRSDIVRRRVAQACLDLLAEGSVGLGPVEVAARAGVSRATLHRWWPTKEDRLIEALTLHTADLGAPDTGSWEGDLRALATMLGRFFSQPIEISLNALMASGAHPDFNRTVLQHYEPLFVGWRAIVDRAWARGEVRAGLDPDAVLSTLLSPLLMEPLLFRAPVTDRRIERLVELVVRATSNSPTALTSP